MTNTELIIVQAKRIAMLESVTDYQRDQITELEDKIRLQTNTTESNDDIIFEPCGSNDAGKEAEKDLPLSEEGLKAKCQTIMV